MSKRRKKRVMWIDDPLSDDSITATQEYPRLVEQSIDGTTMMPKMYLDKLIKIEQRYRIMYYNSNKQR